MTPEERTLLTGFFDRLGQAPATAKDQEADGLIRAAAGRDPDLAYRLAQTALVYEQGLAAAQEQIRSLQAQLQARPAAPAGGSFLGSVPRVPFAGAGAGQRIPGGSMFAGRGPGGQGFLGSAMSTALGVAGGMALFSGLESMFSGGSGMAAEAAAPAADAAADTGSGGPWGAADPGATDPGPYDQGTDDPGGYDSGDYDAGGFDSGGDFDF